MCEFGLVVVRVAKLVVVALVIVGIDGGFVREEGVVHGVIHFARFPPHARGSVHLAARALGPGPSHEMGRPMEGLLNMGKRRVA